MKDILMILVKKNKKKIIISLSIVFVVVLFLVFNNKDEVHASDYVEEQLEIVEIPKVEEVKEQIEEKIENNIQKIKVDIKGEILNPGVYELELGNRIIDVVNLSGGFTNNAVTTNVNLSKKIYDEMVILIPDKGNVCEIIQDYNSLDNEEKNVDNGLVNINTASKEDLLNLTGVGESKADAIIEYRKQNKFESIEDIMNIPGIKESLFNKIKDEITV